MSEYITETAWKFILAQGIKELPVDPFKLILQNGWEVYSYRDFSEIVHKSVSALISNYDNDGFVFWSKRKNNFVISYNSLLPFPVCRWTLLHEIGHIHLGHVNSNCPLVTRVRTSERPFFEIEAQGFARRVLCPSIVLHGCRAFEVDEIISLCGISREAAEYRSTYIKELEARNKFCIDPLEREVEKQFAPFVRRYLQRKLCEAQRDFKNKKSRHYNGGGRVLTVCFVKFHTGVILLYEYFIFQKGC